MKTAFIFPGQGSQYIGMGKDFFVNFKEAKMIYQEADDLLKFNLSKLIFEGSEEDLKNTLNSQLGIFVTSIALLKVLNSEFEDIKPSICAGLSLGEYSALVASKKIDYKEALVLVQKRASLMSLACEKNKGTMAAIIGLDYNIIEETIAKLNPPYNVWVANYNTLDQTVISGSDDGVSIASSALIELGAKKVVPLKVEGAFHSGLMKEAQDNLREYIEKSSFSESEIPIIMNTVADFVSLPSEIKEKLILQITHSVQWTQTMKLLEKEGVELYVEIGPSKTLSMMLRKSKNSGKILNLEKISDLEKISNDLR